jgi:hypothetical protein
MAAFTSIIMTLCSGRAYVVCKWLLRNGLLSLLSACGCGMQDAEVDVLGRVAAALNVPPTVVELKIFEWQVRWTGTQQQPWPGMCHLKDERNLGLL